MDSLGKQFYSCTKLDTTMIPHHLEEMLSSNGVSAVEIVCGEFMSNLSSTKDTAAASPMLVGYQKSSDSAS